MYPIKLEKNKENVYYRESDCFSENCLHLTHAYLHSDYKTKMHSHQFYEINIISSGEGRHYIGDASIPTSVGDIFVLPPEVFHGYHTNGALDISHIILRTDFITRYREELEAMSGFSMLFDIEPRLRRSAGYGCNLRLSPQMMGRVGDTFENIMRAERSEQYSYANALTLALIGMLCDLLQRSIEQNTFPNETGDLLRVMSYIRDNIDRKLTLDTLAAMANMSRSTLNRHFRKALNISPMQYVTHCRISRARELVLEGRLSRTEIASACGFYDIAHMNKYL